MVIRYENRGHRIVRYILSFVRANKTQKKEQKIERRTNWALVAVLSRSSVARIIQATTLRHGIVYKCMLHSKWNIRDERTPAHTCLIRHISDKPDRRCTCISTVVVRLTNTIIITFCLFYFYLFFSSGRCCECVAFIQLNHLWTRSVHFHMSCCASADGVINFTAYYDAFSLSLSLSLHWEMNEKNISDLWLSNKQWTWIIQV